MLVKEHPRKPQARPDWPDRFIEELRSCGIVTTAAACASVDIRTVYYKRDRDPEFAARMGEALEYAIDAAEAELYRRGVMGTNKPLSHQGRLTGQSVKEYDTTALIFYLKGRRREVYGDKFEHTGKDGGPIQVENDPESLASVFARAREERRKKEGLPTVPQGDGIPPIPAKRSE